MTLIGDLGRGGRRVIDRPLYRTKAFPPVAARLRVVAASDSGLFCWPFVAFGYSWCSEIDGRLFERLVGLDVLEYEATLRGSFLRQFLKR